MYNTFSKGFTFTSLILHSWQAGLRWTIGNRVVKRRVMELSKKRWEQTLRQAPAPPLMLEFIFSPIFWVLFLAPSWKRWQAPAPGPPLMLECRRLEVVLASGRRRRHGSGSWSPAPLESGRRTQSVAGGSRERAKEGARESSQHHPHWDSLCCTRGKARLPSYVFCICGPTNKCQKKTNQLSWVIMISISTIHTETHCAAHGVSPAPS